MLTKITAAIEQMAKAMLAGLRIAREILLALVVEIDHRRLDTECSGSPVSL